MRIFKFNPKPDGRVNNIRSTSRDQFRTDYGAASPPLVGYGDKHRPLLESPPIPTPGSANISSFFLSDPC